MIRKPNDYVIEANRAIILVESKILGNYGVIIDKEDLEKVMQYRWYIAKNDNGYYAKTNIKEGQKFKSTYMHRLLKDCPKNRVIDHRNGNGLDNRKCNLKICTQKENTNNQKLSSNNTSGYRNICWNRINKTWDVQIKHKRIGQYNELKDAVIARNKYLIENMANELCLLYDRF